MDKIVKDSMDNSMDYKSYRSMIEKLLAEGKTTGTTQSEELLHYANLNLTRMKRLDKTTAISDEVNVRLQSISMRQTWLIITEGWCGDAAQIIPVLEAMAAISDEVSTRYVLRDEHLELIDMHLTNGGRSIPKVLLIDEERNEVYATWGPRPAELQAIIDDNKSSESPKPYAELSVDVQRWYAKDKTTSIQSEFSAILG